MQTTLRIDDHLYREAKAEAARQGVTLTRFLEEGIKLRLEKLPPPAGAPHSFRIFEADTPTPYTTEDIRRIADEEQERHDLQKIDHSSEPS